MMRLFNFLAIAAAFVLTPASIVQASETVAYEYDELGRLKKVTKSGTAPTGGQVITYTYDPAGNRVNYTSTGAIGGGANATVITLSQSPSAIEGGILSFTLFASPPPAIATTVNYTTANGTAVASTNYVSGSGSVTFEPNQTIALINVATINDGVITPNLNMTLTLSAPTAGATLGTTSAAGTIFEKGTAPLFVVVPINGFTLTWMER